MEYKKILLSPLGTKYEIDEKGDILRDFLFDSETLAVYCDECKRKSIFQQINKCNPIDKYQYGIIDYDGNPLLPNSPQTLSINEIYKEYLCSCNSENSKIYFKFIVKNCELIKVAQHPSILDMKKKEVKETQKEYEDYLTKANILASYGEGIGAYAYLRRILEKIVSYLTSTDIETAKNEPFIKIVEKLKEINLEIYSMLIGNPQIYETLSGGIHSMSNNDCLKICKDFEEIIMKMMEEFFLKKEKKEDLSELKKLLIEESKK